MDDFSSSRSPDQTCEKSYMSAEMIGRLLGRAKELGLSPRGLSLKAGLGPTTVRDIVQRPGASPRAETVRKLAEALDTTPEWLLYDVAVGTSSVLLSAQEFAAAPTKEPSAQADLPAQDRFVEATYGGTLQAGNWREVDDFEGEGREPETVPRDSRFPRNQYVLYDVAGDSMNAADPPMPAGCQVLAIATRYAVPPIGLRPGDIVVIERKQAQGGLIERSIKEYDPHEDVTRFLPRSTNPRHKPIEVRNNPDEEDEGVEVIGLVIKVMSNVKRR